MRDCLNFKTKKASKVNGYLSIVICFLFFLIVFEVINVGFLAADSGLVDLGKALFFNLIASCLYVVVIFITYILIRLIHEKSAFFISAFLFSILLLSEIGLTLYEKQTGNLIGSELLARPLNEMIITIKASMGIWQSVLIVVGVIVGFITISYVVSKIKFKKCVCLCLSIIIIVFAAMLPIYLNASKNAVNCNKTLYFIEDIIESSNHPKAESDYKFDKEKIQQYLSYNSDYEVPDIEYPMERIDNIPDVLSPYFNASDKSPNIVVLVIESLGMENFGNPCFAPFMDSLSNHSLFWSNCLSTTSRSFGAIPAITGSLASPRGFQFGDMPAHNSLISILNANEYQTNAFYAGEFTFDCIYEYLSAQNIDYLSPFWNEYSKQGGHKGGNGTWWGYYDGIMFDKSLQVLENQDKKPCFSLFTTLTTHDALNLSDKSAQRKYEDEIDQIISNLPAEKQGVYNKDKMRYAAMLYTDDCVKEFINRYLQSVDSENTIFVITGDHASGINNNGKLSFYHVPLIIWSPLLNESQKFTSLVTHNDITPSLVELLKNKYSLSVPNTIHYAGIQLDTSSSRQLKNKLLFVNYNREIREFIYGDYYYHTANKWEGESLYRINDNLELEMIYNDSLMSEMRKMMDVYKYIYDYAYRNDRMIKKSVQEKDDYKQISSIDLTRTIRCQTPSKKPSEVGTAKFDLLSDYSMTDKYKKVKVGLTADVFIVDSLWTDEYMDIVFECKTANENIICRDKIYKFLDNEIIRANNLYHLQLSKEFLLNYEDEPKFSVYVSSVIYDDQWVPDSKLEIRKAKITIEGVTE